MSMINISFDTVTKKMKVDMDGVEMMNVTSAGCYQKYDSEECACEVTMASEDEKSETKTYTRLCSALVNSLSKKCGGDKKKPIKRVF